MSIFKLPDLGEGLVDAEIVEWFFKEGDEVAVDEIIVSLETAKAIVDIPSPEAGKIIKLYGQPGEIIQTGDPLLEFESEGETSDIQEKEQTHQKSSSVVGELPDTEETLKETAQSVSQSHTGVKATPAVRALARRMDIDLTIVTPSGPDGTVKASDVERVAKIFSHVGKLEPLKGVRRAMSMTMSQAHAEVVPVTINDDVDINGWPDNSDITLRLIRALIKACQQEPTLNAWYDSHSVGRRLIKQIHLGLAVDTKDGLFVPVLREVETLATEALREKIDSTVELVKSRRIASTDLRGNTITLSNFGSIGGKYANPIIVPPTVAILGAGRSYQQARANKDKVEMHTMLPLSLTFDHRSVTGGEAGRFLQVMIKDLSAVE